MVIDVYADIVCPWCYIGTRRLAAALEQRPELAIERRWRPFQLRPEMPARGQPWADFVREKFGGMAQAQPIFARVTSIGAVDGISFAFDRIASAPNTRDAHRLILLARERGLEWPMVEALFAAHFAEGRNLNDADDLAAAAARAGLDAAAARDLLASDAYGDAVDQSQRTAARLDIQGVPFCVIDHSYGISGAQPVELFVRAIDVIAEGVPAE
jgi:predicted DsbA family dithiol-disulfide isomerase